MWASRQRRERSSWGAGTALGSKERSGERSNLVMIVVVPWRKNEDGAKMDGERLTGEVVMTDKDYREKLEMEEDVLVPR